MAKASAKDTFANIAYLTVTESGPNTLTFAQLNLANNLMSQKSALIIHRLDVFMSSLSNFNSTADYTDIGLCLSNRLTSISDLSQPELLMFLRLARLDLGAAASGMIDVQPRTFDYNNMPGGGIIIPADRLFAGIASSGAAAAQGAYIRMYYTVMELAEVDYWQLIEARRVMTT